MRTKKITTRTHSLHIKFNDYEHNSITEISQTIGCTLSDFIRMAVIEKIERIKMYEEKK